VSAIGAPGTSGALSVQTLTWNAESDAKTFTYTPATRGPVTITAVPQPTANLGVPVTVPAPILAMATTLATTYLLVGPTALALQQAGTFVVRLPSDTDLVGSVTITPGVSGGTGVFSPTSVALSQASPVASFLYLPTNGGTHTVATTNSSDLDDPDGIACLVEVRHRGTLVTVGTTPTLLAPPTTDRRLLFFQVRGAGTVYLGGPNVSATDGIALDSTATPTPIDNLTGEAWYGIAASGTVSVYVHWI
jgi:hypothetical protein